MHLVRQMLGAVLCASALAVTACGGDAPTESGPPTVNPPAVGRVTVAPSQVELQVGESSQLTAVAVDPYGQPIAGVTISWMSLDGEVAGVSSGGLVNALQGGIARIVASAAGRADTATVTVIAPPVVVPPEAPTEPPTEGPSTEPTPTEPTSPEQPAAVATISIAQSSSSTPVGGTVQLTASAYSAAGQLLTGRAVTWAAGTPAVATVSALGVVTGVAPGMATFTATVEGVQRSTTVEVTSAEPADLVLTSHVLTLTIGEAAPLSATVVDADGSAMSGHPITWSTSDAAVATVSVGGLVRAVGPGTAIVTAAGGGHAAQAAVTVVAPSSGEPPSSQPAVATVSIAPQGVTLLPGATAQLTASAFDAGGTRLTGRGVTWTSAATAVASVSPSGLVTAVAAGSATIRATVEGKTATVTVTVQRTPVATVAIARSASSVQVGGTAQFTASARSADNQLLSGRAVTWSTSAPGIATVSALGVVTGVAPGTATIAATVEGVQVGATITVTAPPPASVTVAPSSVALEVAQTRQLAATVRDANGQPLAGHAITWSTSSPGVATVSSSGLVTAVGAGSATITVTGGGRSTTVPVTVTLSAPVRGSATIVRDTAGTVVGVGGTEAALPGVLLVGDNDEGGLAPLQAIVVFSLTDVPPGATIESASLPVSMDPDAVVGSPFELGSLYAERAMAIAMNTGALGSGAVLVSSAQVASVEVDVAALVQTAIAAGDGFVVVRFRFPQSSNADAQTDQLELGVGSLQVSWVK